MLAEVGKVKTIVVLFARNLSLVRIQIINRFSDGSCTSTWKQSQVLLHAITRFACESPTEGKRELDLALHLDNLKIYNYIENPQITAFGQWEAGCWNGAKFWNFTWPNLVLTSDAIFKQTAIFFSIRSGPSWSFMCVCVCVYVCVCVCACVFRFIYPLSPLLWCFCVYLWWINKYFQMSSNTVVMSFYIVLYFISLCRVPVAT